MTRRFPEDAACRKGQACFQYHSLFQATPKVLYHDDERYGRTVLAQSLGRRRCPVAQDVMPAR